MLPAELAREVKRIQFVTGRQVADVMAGAYLSVFKGRGMEFDEVRPYVPGDDVRTIDWNVTARLGHPFVKRFVEERELTVVLVVDLSASQRWGTRGRFKSELVTEVAATIAMSAMRNNDRVGLLLVTDRVELFVPPRKGRRHTLRLIRDLLAFRPESRGTELAEGLEYAVRTAPARSIVFVFSDFQLGEGWDRFTRALTFATARHDVVAVRLSDPGEARLPDVGLLLVRDPESGETVAVDTSSRGARERYAELVAAEAERARRLFRRLRVDEIELRTDAPSTPALLSFFGRRERRLRR